MRARRLRLTGLVSLCVSCTVLVLACASAGAAVIHGYLSQITEVPAGSGVSAPGPFAAMESMSVDSGRLWVAERFNGGSRADLFVASTGAFVSQLVPTKVAFSKDGGGIAVGHVTGQAEVYAGATNESGEPVVAVFSEAGALQATWTGADVPGGSFGGAIKDVAVDNSSNPLDEGRGDVYVAVPSQHVVDVFRPEAGGKEKYVTQLTGVSPSEPFGYPSKVDVNEANGDVIVLDPNVGAVDVFEPTVLGYAFVRKIPVNRAFGLAVDGGGGESNGEIYVTEGFHPVTISQFSSTGALLGRITGADSPGGDISDVYALAVDPVSHDVYVADNRQGGEGTNAVKVFGPDVVIPDVTTAPVSNVTAGSATLSGTVNPHKAGAATCQFVWGTTTEFGHTAPCTSAVAEGGSPVPVEVSLSGLEPDTNYCYRLQASDAHGTNLGEASQDQCFTTSGPGLHEEAVSAVTAESVTFDATIDPHNAPTTYYVQYGTTSAYGTSVPAPPGATVGSGEGDLEVTQHVQGLQADTVYHYRVVALSEVGGRVEEFDFPDRTFTTQRKGGELGLPDGREWELVTPPDKQGALFFGPNLAYGADSTVLVAQASAGGGAMVDLANVPSETEPQGNTSEVSVLSTRGPAGWSSQVIAPPHAEATGPSFGNGAEYRFFSEDLSRGVVQPFGNFTPLSPEASESTAYLHSDYLNGNVDEHCQSSCYQPLVTKANTRAGAVFGEEFEGACLRFLCGPHFLDATSDLSHVVLQTDVQLTSVTNEPEPKIQGEENIRFYEWSAGRLQPLYLLPKDEGGIGVYAGQPSELLSPIYHQLSDGGSVFFTYNGHLYLHDFAKDESVRLDVAQSVAEPIEGAAKFLYASSDGSRVLFTDSKQLTKAGGGGIYECRIVETAGGVTCELELTGLSGSFVDGSKDASYLYFMGTGEKLMVDRRSGQEWTTTEGPVIPQTETSGFLPNNGNLPTFRISPNGRFIAFMSDQNLTGYDNRDAVSGRPDEEVYLYDASSNKLVCASCNPTGARSVGVTYNGYELVAGDFSSEIPVASSVPPWTRFESVGKNGSRGLYQPRYLSDSGRLFFNSDDALVPQDVNGTQDVYEYEPVGAGTCGASSVTFGERSDGCVSLVSSGSSPEESAFLDASETGGDVFFLTAAKLVSQDYDTALDVYDAHECSSAVPCYPQPRVAPPACSTGDGCKASPSPQPSIFGPSPSATFSGAGNVIPSAAAPVVGGRSLSRAQKLANALKACHRKPRRQRGVCERKARKQYGAVRSRKASAKRKGR